MKLATCDNATEKVGITKVNSFAIEASAKAFTILSDTLYSNKIRAVVRELSTNAYDAHIEVGSVETPFQVSFPTRFDSNFSVRDFGPGLSHEDCMGLYTTYFRSTKTNSNEAVGCLGLGSKSPFAYSDTFTVESVYQGMKRVYVANKGSDAPEFNLLNEEETNDPSGLCVRVPVRAYDYNTFKYEAESVYSHFYTKPTCNLEMKYPDYKAGIQISDNNWYISKNVTGNFIVMGQVAYPIKSDKFVQKFPEISEFLEKISGLVVTAPIGAVEMTPSREELSYNSTTVNYIVDSLGKVVDTLIEKIAQEIDSCPGIHEARLMYLQMPASYKPNKMQYKGEVMFPNQGKQIRIPAEFQKKVSKYVGSKYQMYDNRVESFSPLDIFVLDANVSYKRERYSTIQKPWELNIVVFTGTKEEFMQMIGTNNPDVIIDLATRAYVPRSRNSGGSIPCQMYDKAKGEFVDSKMSVKYENAHYISESRGVIWLDGRTYDHKKFAAFIKELEAFGFDLDGDIYTVKPSQITTSGLSARKNWTCLKSVLKSFIDKLKLDNVDNFTKAYTNVDKQCKGILEGFKNFSTIQEFTTILDSMEQAICERETALIVVKKFSNTTYFKRYLEYSYDVIEDWKFSHKVKRLVQEYYPMLSYDKHALNPTDIQYVQDMDELRKIRQDKLNETILEETQEITCEPELVVL